MIRRNLYRLLDKYLNGHASPEEHALLESWLETFTTQSSFFEGLDDAEIKQIEEDLLKSILQRIEQLRNQRLEFNHQITGDLDYASEHFQEKSIDLIKHPANSTLIHPYLSADDPCFKLMLPYLPQAQRDTLIWTQLDKLPIQEVAVKLRLSASGARSRLQRAHEKLISLVRRCCVYQYDAAGQILSCMVNTFPGCCERSISLQNQ